MGLRLISMILGIGILPMADMSSPEHTQRSAVIRRAIAPHSARHFEEVQPGGPSGAGPSQATSVTQTRHELPGSKLPVDVKVVVHVSAGGSVAHGGGPNPGGMEGKCAEDECRHQGECIPLTSLNVHGDQGQCVCAPGTCIIEQANDGLLHCYHSSFSNASQNLFASVSQNLFADPKDMDGTQPCECNRKKACKVQHSGKGFCVPSEQEGEAPRIAGDQGQCVCAPDTCIIGEARDDGNTECYHNKLDGYFKGVYADPVGQNGTQQCECVAEKACKLKGQCFKAGAGTPYVIGDQGQCTEGTTTQAP